MTTLVLLCPERAPDAPPPAADEPIAYVLSADGIAVSDQGTAPAARLPRADTVVAVLPPHAVSWHRLALPKAPAGRMRAALGGLLEERLLDDDEELHLALAPDARAGAPCWVAAQRKTPLADRLAAWDALGLHPDRVVAAVQPGATPLAHVHAAVGAEATPWISLADDSQAATLPLDGGLARARVAEFQARHGGTLRVSATPASAAAAERWLGQPVVVRAEAESALAAARVGWELRQFDLAPSLRGTRALGRLGRRLMGPDWRWARRGLAVLVAGQLVGLNVVAWRLNDSIETRRQAQVELLRAAHPQVRAVLDAPLQMRRETDRLRAAAGIAGDADLESAIEVTGRAWPPGLPPTPSLRWEPGRLTLAAAGWPPAQIDAFVQRLRAAGWRAEFSGALVVLSRAEAAAPASPKGAL